MNRNLAVTLCVVLVAAGVAVGGGACRKPKDPANAGEMKEKLQGGVKFALWKVDATDDQKRQFDMMLDGLSVDLFAVQVESQALVRQTMIALDAPVVDPEELARIEAAGTAVFDRYMKRMVRAGLDVSKILSPEQRHQVVGLWHDWEFGD